MEIISQEDIKLKKQQDARSALVKKYKRYRKILNKKMLNKISNDENILIHLKNEENIDYIIEEFKKEILNISSLKSNIKKISVMETYLNEKYNKLISDLNEINNFDKFILYSCFDELLTNDMSIFNNSFVFNLISNTNFIKIKTKLNEKIQLKFYNQDLIIDINLSYDNKILKAKSLENLKKLKSLESKKNIISKIEFSEFEVEKFLIETFEKITKDNILINKDNLLKNQYSIISLKK